MRCEECNGSGGFGVDILDSYPCPHCENGHIENHTITSTANKIIKILKREGFTIQRYDSYSSNSVYLKLDFGVMNSIRISDHPSKKGLMYKYNILTIVKKFRLEKPEHHIYRYYYPIDDTKRLISDILKIRKQKMDNMGEPAYRVEMRKMLIKHRDDDGFWKQSIYV